MTAGSAMVERETTLVLEDARVAGVDAVVHQPSHRRRPAVLLTHGAGGNLHDEGVTAMARALADAGHLVVRANLPYRQASPRGGPPRAERSVPDLAGVLASARVLAPRTPWVIGGKSYGGRVATMLAAEDGDVVGVIALGYPLHPPGKPEQLRVGHFDRLAVPLLIVQGGNDPFGRPDELTGHVDRLAAGATIVVVAGGDHSLRVSRTASPVGVTHTPTESVSSVAEQIIDWTNALGARGA